MQEERREIAGMDIYSSFQLGEQISTAEDAEGRRGWLIVLKLCVPLRPLRLVILFIQAKYAVKRSLGLLASQSDNRVNYSRFQAPKRL
jgi:hypothetical protein